jgi:DNA-binding winged helix-turn-helix (wHTH) protein
MSAMPVRPGTLRFGAFEVLLDSGELLEAGRKVRLQHRSFQVLVCLLEKPGAVVTREELASRLWPDGVFVDLDHGLNAAVNRLRRVLGDSASSPRFIETLPRRGYRFVAEVEGLSPSTVELASSDSVDSFDHISGVVRLRTLLEKDSELSSLELRDLPADVAAVLERIVERGAHRGRSLRRLAALLKTFRPGDTSPSEVGQDSPAPENDLVRFIETLRKEAPSDGAHFFVGREEECTRLDRHLREALEGRGHPVFVTGEAGSGKSALIQAFAAGAVERNPELVAAGGTASAEPYLGFRELMGLLTGDLQVRRASGVVSFENALRLSNLLPGAVRTLLQVAPDLVGSLLPGEALLSRASPGIGASERRRLRHLLAATPPPLGEGPHQASLFEQCTQLFIELSRRQPLLLILEDLHRADSGTVSLLFHLCRRVAGYPILVVGSYRPVELAGQNEEGRHPLDAVIHELQSHRSDLELRLEGSSSLVDTLVESHASGVPSERREEIFRLARGNPLFTMALLEAGYEQAEDPIPPRIGSVLAERLAGLSERERRILDLASVDGEEFTAEVVAGADGSNEREVVQVLSGQLDRCYEIVQAADVRRSGDRRLSVYRFRQPIMQRYLYQRLDRVERSYLHEGLGRTLETLVGQRSSEWASELVRHYESAGLAEDAARFSEE